MANFFLDISAIGAEYQAYADTPTTWNKPQDGNGKAQSASAAAVAIATIDCASASASGAGSLSLLGVTVSSTLTGSAATLAANIVTAINAAATAVSASYSAALLPLNRLVWARQNPGLTTQVQIMMRVAGADWNGMLPVSGGTWSVAPTMGAFAGGVDGPYGYFTNNGTIFGKTQCAGGIWGLKSLGVTDPSANDPIITRTRRSGVDLAVVINAAATITCRAISNRCFIFDDGTTWAGDNGQFGLDFLNSSAYSTFFDVSNNCTAILSARSRYGFRLRGRTGQSGYATYIGGNGNNSRLLAHRCLFEAYDATAGTGLSLGFRSAFSERLVLTECRVLGRNNRTITAALNGNYDIWFRAVNTIFEWVGVGSNVTSLLSASGNVFASTYSGAFEFIGCEFIVDGGAYKVAAFMSGGSNITDGCNGRFVVENCKGLDNPSLGMGVSSSKYPTGPQFIWRDRDTNSFRAEKAVTTFDYVSSSAYPYIDATTINGTPFSYRISWEAARLDNNFHHVVGSLSEFYRGASGVLTINAELYTPTTEVPNKAEICATVSYTDSSGVLRTETTDVGIGLHIAGVAPALPVSANTWNPNGITLHEGRLLGLTTAYPVKQNSEINLQIEIHAAPSGTHNIYAHPDLSIS